MEREKVEKALARIEAAAARIEAASARAPTGSDPDLGMKYAQLQGTVSASLRELDALIGKLER